MTLLFLGTGTSTGVPQLGCTCPTCTSVDPRDRRMRASALVTTDNGTNILIDCGPDFYHQMLRAAAPRIDAVLLTHIHYDHVGGIDDLRPYCSRADIPVYCQASVQADLRARLPYCFVEHPYPGVPHFDMHVVEPFTAFTVNDNTVLPVPVMHYRLEILGFRIGNLAYITDCKTMPDATVRALAGVDTLVLNALRHAEHLSHLNIKEALRIIERIGPRQAFLTHLSHQFGPHAEAKGFLPPNVHVAYDTLEIHIP